jgi:hypothetical protein
VSWPDPPPGVRTASVGEALLRDPDDPRLDAAAALAAAAVGERLDEIVDDFLRAVVEVDEAEPWRLPETFEPARQNARRDIGREVAALEAGGRLPRECPEEVRLSAEMAVAYGMPLGLALQGYRLGHRVQRTAWERAVRDLALPVADERELLERGSRFMFAYADRCSWWMEAEYTRERDGVLRSAEQRRMQVISALLDGRQDVDLDALGYEIGAEHLAIVACGARAREAIEELARDVGGHLLVVDVDPTTSWGWVTAPSSAEMRRALRSLSPPDGARVAVGGPAPAADGFRRAHEEALDAERIGRRRHPPVTVYDDVALEVLAARDEAAAREFVARELGNLDRDDEREGVLRDTLRAYLAAGQQASSASALLGVHERTVANRLRAAEERLGRPIAARHAELDTALRLRELLSDPS